MLKSFVCQRSHFRSNWLAVWADRLGFPPPAEAHLHRKVWEWCAIGQALFERGVLRPGKRGLGFAVGTEPLVSAFSQLGAEIEATDLAHGPTAETWSATNQHAASKDVLFRPELVDRELFSKNVTFRHADMNDLSQFDKSSYDFLWSSCAIEHLGSLERGFSFVEHALDLLRPGGVACHTTEFNVSSLVETIEVGDSVIYRESDVRGLDRQLRKRGCCIESLCFDIGDDRDDVIFDAPPYGAHGGPHIKLALEGHIATSMLLICRRYE